MESRILTNLGLVSSLDAANCSWSHSTAGLRMPVTLSPVSASHSPSPAFRAQAKPKLFDAHEVMTECWRDKLTSGLGNRLGEDFNMCVQTNRSKAASSKQLQLHCCGALRALLCADQQRGAARVTRCHAHESLLVQLYSS